MPIALFDYNGKKSSTPFWLFFLGLWGIQIVILFLVINDMKYNSWIGTIPYRILFSVFCMYIVWKYKLYDKIISNNVLILVYVFFFLVLLRIFFDGFILYKHLGTPGTIYLLKFLSIIVFPSFAFTIKLDEDYAKKAMDGVKYSCVLFLVIGFLYYQNGLSADYRSLFYQGELSSGEFINAMTFSYIGYSLLGIVLWEILYKKKRFGIIVFVLLLLALYAMLYGGTRNVFLSMPIMILYIISKRVENVKSFVYISAFLFLFMLILYFFYLNFGAALFGRFDLLYDQVNSGDPNAGSGRLFIWMSGISEYLQSPFLGSGIEVSSVHFTPHNMYIQSFMSTGLIGGILFISIILITFYNGGKLMQQKSSLGWLVILFVERVITGMMSTSLFDPLFWLPVVAINANSRKIV